MASRVLHRCRLLFAVKCVLLAGTVPGAGADPPAGLRLSLHLDATSYALGQPIFLLVKLTNTGDKVIRARVDRRELDEIDLEIAFGEEPLRKLRFRMIYYLRTPIPYRDFKPKESVARSEPILLRERALSLWRRDPRNWPRTLICDKPGSYRLRAYAGVSVAGRGGFRVKSEEVRFRVRPAEKGARRFVQFAVANFEGGLLKLSDKAYKDARQASKDLAKTPYGRYVRWAMLDYYARHRMDDKWLEDLSASEKREREEYARVAKDILAEKRKIWTCYEERALVYLVEYYFRAKDTRTALRYAKLLEARMPWSRAAGAGERLERHLKRAKQNKGEPDAAKPGEGP